MPTTESSRTVIPSTRSQEIAAARTTAPRGFMTATAHSLTPTARTRISPDESLMGKRAAIAVIAVAVLGAAFFVAVRGRGGSRVSRAFEIRGSRPVEGRFSGMSYVRRSPVTRGESSDLSSDGGYHEE